MSAITEASNSIAEFNIELMELVIQCWEREVGDELLGWAVRPMAESVNLISLNGITFMTAHRISTTLLNMTTLMTIALGSVELSVFVFLLFCRCCVLHTAKIIVTCYNLN